MIKVLYPSCDFMRKSSCRHFQFWRQRIKTVSIAHNPEKLLLDYALYFLGTNLWTVKERTYYYEKNYKYSFGTLYAFLVKYSSFGGADKILDYADRPSFCLYSSGLSPPREILIRFSRYQTI